MSPSTSHSTPVPVTPPQDFHYKYTVQTGLFLQSEDSTDDTKFDFKKQNFGLIDRNYPTDSASTEGRIWPRFERYIRSLASSTPPGTSLKVLFLGRHGQGEHNVAEAKYGTRAWDCYWSYLDGADGLMWSDARLTRAGEQQALDVHALWEAQLALGLPPPDRCIVSPLTRTVQTADLSFRNLSLPAGKQYRPYVKELLREALGVHTCDRRSSLAHLRTEHPHLAFEPGFSDPDVLWQPDYREPSSARRYRLATLLDEVFAESGEEDVFLSLTSHSGAIASMLEVLGHRKFALETGGVIPVVVRAEKVQGKREVPEKEPSDAPPRCEEPPEWSM
ncbi:hypothetical protein G6514_000846 [Epicoccum nigrum]|nr:hypothetical protein G6514_000846 [Epicoccum nigrum]